MILHSFSLELYPMKEGWEYILTISFLVMISLFLCMCVWGSWFFFFFFASSLFPKLPHIKVSLNISFGFLVISSLFLPFSLFLPNSPSLGQTLKKYSSFIYVIRQGYFYLQRRALIEGCLFLFIELVLFILVSFVFVIALYILIIFPSSSVFLLLPWMPFWPKGRTQNQNINKQ